MRRIRFTISRLLAIVLVIGVGIAALRESNEIWDSGVFTLTLGVLLISILLAVHRTEAKRAFWIGFALFGWIYLVISLVPSIESRLITTKALAYLDSKVPRRSLGTFTFRVSATGSGAPSNQVHHVAFTLDGTQLAASSPGQVIWDAAAGRLLSGWGGSTENFVRIGHLLIALIVAFLGGQIPRHVCARHGETTRESVTP